MNAKMSDATVLVSIPHQVRCYPHASRCCGGASPAWRRTSIRRFMGQIRCVQVVDMLL